MIGDDHGHVFDISLLVGVQAVSKAEGDVSEAQKRLLELEQQKEELDKQLQQTQKALLDGKQRTDKLLEEIRSRIEARTVSFDTSSPDSRAFLLCLPYHTSQV